MNDPKRSNKEFYICGLLMILGILAYSSLYLFNIYPFTEGWGIHYAELIDRGLIPYRDFYYYLPPLSLIIDWFFWKLSFGSLLMFRIWYIVQRLVMVLLLYKLLTKWFAPRYAWLACLTGALLRTAVVWDLGGDYNQTQSLFAIFLIYAVVWFLEKDADSPTKGIGRYKYIFFAGIIIALMVLLKQSAGLAALLVCFIFLIFYCIIYKDKRFGWYCVATAAGAIIPLGLCVSLLAANRALTPFLEQFFGAAGSKGGLGTILLGGWSTIFTHTDHILLFIAFLLTIWSLLHCVEGKTSVHVVVAHLMLLFLSFWRCYKDASFSVMRFLQFSPTVSAGLGLLFILTIVFIQFGNSHYLQVFSNKISTWPAAVLYSILFLLAYQDFQNTEPGFYENLYKNTSLFSDIPAVITYFSIYGALLCLIAQFYHYAKTGKSLYPKAMMFLFAGGLADAYANIMNTSTWIYPITVFILAPVMILILFALDLRKWNPAKNLVLCLFCVIVCSVCISQKYTTAYSWWGNEVTYPLHQRTEAVELDAMAGLRLPEQRKLEYEEITKIIEENADEGSTVWGFPHIKIFNVLTDRYTLDDPVPVLFYDVCSDNASVKEAEWLEENPPTFVIWCDMYFCIEQHEILFRNGEPLGQRKIIEWFKEVKNANYIKVGQVGNLFVYKLSDGSPVRYTYFQEPGKINYTAGENEINETYETY